MSDPQTVVVAALQSLLDRRDGNQLQVELDADFYDVLELDSLEVAEFSAVLEDDLGRDPYSEGLVLRTAGEVIAFYS